MDKFGFVLCAATLFAACTKDCGETTEGPSASDASRYAVVSFRVPSSRTTVDGTVVTWNPGDAIGVFLADGTNETATFTSQCRFVTAAGDGVFTGEVPLGNYKRVLMFYPYNPEIRGFKPMPVSLERSTDRILGDQAYMTAVSDGVYDIEGPVTFAEPVRMEQILSQVQFVVDFGDRAAEITGPDKYLSLALYGSVPQTGGGVKPIRFEQKGSYSIRQQLLTWAAATTYNIVEIVDPVTTPTLAVGMVVSEQTLPSGTILKVDVSVNDDRILAASLILDRDFTFVKGRVHRLLLNLDSSNPNVQEVTRPNDDPDAPFGDGSMGNPFRIFDEATLVYAKNEMMSVPAYNNGDVYYVQIRDITVQNEFAHTSDDDVFKANYDGGGNKVVFRAGVDAGMFNRLSGKASVSNLSVSGELNPTGETNGLLAGMAGTSSSDEVTVSNCHVTGNVTATQPAGSGLLNLSIGGLIGQLRQATVDGCSAFLLPMEIRANSSKCYIGGLIGMLGADPNVEVGAVVLRNSFSSGYLRVQNDSPQQTMVFLGGMVGALRHAQGEIENCYAVSSLQDYVDEATFNPRNVVAMGGLIGTMDAGRVYNGYGATQFNLHPDSQTGDGFSDALIWNFSGAPSAIAEDLYYFWKEGWTVSTDVSSGVRFTADEAGSVSDRLNAYVEARSSDALMRWTLIDGKQNGLPALVNNSDVPADTPVK